MIDLYMPDGVVWLDTASGSRYRIDTLTLTWARLSHDPRSDGVRSRSGPLLGLGGPPVLGLPAVIYGPGHASPAFLRRIVTTPVVRVWDREPDEPHGPVDGWWDPS